MKKDPWYRNRRIRDAIYASIQEKMRRSPEVYILGEGSHMKIHYDAPEIEKEFPGRFLTMPICEDSNTNFAVGLSIAGLVPIVDVISSDFLYRTMDAICNTVAKTQFVHSPRTIIIRAEFLTGGPTSGQRVEGLFTGIPGLNVVVPACPRDAGRLMAEALERPEPTLFFEERMIDDGALADAVDDLPFGKARTWRRGTRATIATYGLCLQKFLAWDGDVDIVDLRSLSPLDVDAVITSVSETGRLIVVEPADTGAGARLIAQVAARTTGRGRDFRFEHIAGPRAVIPACRELHDRMIPGPEDIKL